MDAFAKEVNEDLNAVDNTFGDDDTLLDDKLKEAAKTLQDGQVYGEVVEGENAYFVVRMDSVLDRRLQMLRKKTSYPRDSRMLITTCWISGRMMQTLP